MKDQIELREKRALARLYRGGWFSLDASNARFWRAEVFDTTRNLRIAIGNPIWNAV